MNILIMQSDECAVKTVSMIFGKPSKIETESELLKYVYNIGGPRSICIYSLIDKDMFFDSGQKSVQPEAQKALYVLFEKKDLKPKRGELAQYGESAKDWNKASRQVLTPVELQEADVFLCMNQKTDLKKEVNLESIKNQLISMSKVEIPAGKGMVERGGAVAYTLLPYHRLVTSENIKNIGKISPETKKAKVPKLVWYGTSGPYNLAEILLTLACGYKTGLPVHFDNYGNSDEETLTGQLSTIGFVRKLEKSINHRFDLTLMSTAVNVLEPDQQVRFLARRIELLVGHPVMFLYYPNIDPIMTNSYDWLNRNGHKTVQQLHNEGAHFAGAPIYYSFYEKAKELSFIAILYDGAKGAVHKMARPYMEDPHGLWICPAGSFAIQKSGANHLDPIHPEWFLQKLQDANSLDKSLKEIWDIALERVPLSPDKIGTKVTIEISDQGILQVREV